MPYHFSDAVDDPLLFERIESFGGGMDAYQRPVLLAADVSQYLENVILRDNLEAGTRPGFDALSGAVVSAAKTQGLFYFSTPNLSQLFTAIGGTLYYWEGSSWTTVAGGPHLTDGDTLFAAAQGVDTLVISDGTAAWKNWNGTTLATYGTGATDPPRGATSLCFHAGRMFAAGFSGSGGTGREDDALAFSNILSFGNGAWDLTARSFRVGGGDGDPIVALASMQDNNLCVLKKNSIHLINTAPTSDITNWFDTGVGTNVLSGATGIVGKRAFCNYGNDVLFMSLDGVRSVRRMEAATGQYEVSAPISLPIQPWIDRINWQYAYKICATRFDEFVLFSVPLDSSTSNNYVLAWNGRLGRWMGIWTGLTPVQFAVTRFSSVPRLVFGDNSGYVNQWKLASDDETDSTYLDNGAAIPTKLWTRSMLFGEPVNDKDAYYAEARFRSGAGSVTLTAVTDEADSRNWSVNTTHPGNQLPVDLPFDLYSVKPTTARRGLRGITAFNEIYFKLESTAGWWRLRNLTVAAFLNMLQNQ